jgi:hypothetical protein
MTHDPTPSQPNRRIPKLSRYLPQVIAAASPGTRRSYAPYFERIRAAYGGRRLDKIAATDIAGLMREVEATAARRRNSRDGRGAADHLLLAWIHR